MCYNHKYQLNFLLNYITNKIYINRKFKVPRSHQRYELPGKKSINSDGQRRTKPTQTNIREPTKAKEPQKQHKWATKTKIINSIISFWHRRTLRKT